MRANRRPVSVAVGASLQVMQALMEADVTTLSGPKGKHNMTRTAVRHGRECGSPSTSSYRSSAQDRRV